MVTHVIAQYINDTRQITGSRAHPEDVMVAPLNVQGVVMHEFVDNFIGMGAAIVNIPDNVQMVDGKALNESRQGKDKLVSADRFQYGINNLGVISITVFVFIRAVQDEFDQDKLKME